MLQRNFFLYRTSEPKTTQEKIINQKTKPNPYAYAPESRLHTQYAKIIKLFQALSSMASVPASHATHALQIFSN